MSTLLAIDGPVVVSFTRETRIKGDPVGPLTVVNVNAFKAACAAQGINIDGKLRPIQRVNDVPIAGRHDLGWATRNAALTVAAHYRVALTEA